MKKKTPLQKLKPKPKKSVAKLKKEADKYFSLATRFRFADKGDTAKCVTCGVRKPLTELQCGHFMSRRFNATRYSELNTAPQCVGCNMFRGGEQFLFSQFIEDFYGVGTAKALQKEAKEPHSFTREELEQIIADSKEYIRFYNSSIGVVSTNAVSD